MCSKRLAFVLLRIASVHSSSRPLVCSWKQLGFRSLLLRCGLSWRSVRFFLAVLHPLVNVVKVLSPSFWWSWRVPWSPKCSVPSPPRCFKNSVKRNFYSLAIMQISYSFKKCTYGFPVTIINFPSRVLYTTLFHSSSSHSTTFWHKIFVERQGAEYSYRSAEQGKLTIMLSALTLGIVQGWKISANAFCKKL